MRPSLALGQVQPIVPALQLEVRFKTPVIKLTRLIDNPFSMRSEESF
jgi:hypothetical protein